MSNGTGDQTGDAPDPPGASASNANVPEML